MKHVWAEISLSCYFNLEKYILVKKYRTLKKAISASKNTKYPCIIDMDGRDPYGYLVSFFKRIYVIDGERVSLYKYDKKIKELSSKE